MIVFFLIMPYLQMIDVEKRVPDLFGKPNIVLLMKDS